MTSTEDTMPRGIQRKYHPFGAMPFGMLSNTEGDDNGGGVTPPAEPEPKPEGEQPPADGGPKGGPDALKADLARERDKRQAVEGTVQELKTTLTTMQEAFAKALGVKPDEVPNETEALAKQLDDLRTEIDTAKREALVARVANNHHIPEKYQKYLTETDPTALEAQAVEIAELVKASAGETMPPLAGGARQTPKKPAGSLGEAIAERYASK